MTTTRQPVPPDGDTDHDPHVWVWRARIGAFTATAAAVLTVPLIGWLASDGNILGAAAVLALAGAFIAATHYFNVTAPPARRAVEAPFAYPEWPSPGLPDEFIYIVVRARGLGDDAIDRLQELYDDLTDDDPEFISACEIVAGLARQHPAWNDDLLPVDARNPAVFVDELDGICGLAVAVAETMLALPALDQRDDGDGVYACVVGAWLHAGQPVWENGAIVRPDDHPIDVTMEPGGGRPVEHHDDATYGQPELAAAGVALQPLGALAQYVPAEVRGVHPD